MNLSTGAGDAHAGEYVITMAPMIVRSSIASVCVPVLVVALLWVCLFEFNAWLFAALETSAFVNWVFLPAGVRMFAALLLGWMAVPGLFIGAMLTGDPAQRGWALAAALAAASSFAPVLAALLCRHWFRLRADLRGLSGRRLIVFAFAGALFGATLHGLVFVAFDVFVADPPGLAQPFGNWVRMLLGDFLGATIPLYVAHEWLALRLRRR